MDQHGVFYVVPGALLDSETRGGLNRTRRKIPMELEILDYSLDQVQWGEATRIDGRTLFLQPRDLQTLIKDLSPNIRVNFKIDADLGVQGLDLSTLVKDLSPKIRVDFEIVRPGESKRIVHVLDAVVPLAKLEGPGM